MLTSKAFLSFPGHLFNVFCCYMLLTRLMLSLSLPDSEIFELGASCISKLTVGFISKGVNFTCKFSRTNSYYFLESFSPDKTRYLASACECSKSRALISRRIIHKSDDFNILPIKNKFVNIFSKSSIRKRSRPTWPHYIKNKNGRMLPITTEKPGGHLFTHVDEHRSHSISLRPRDVIQDTSDSTNRISKSKSYA